MEENGNASEMEGKMGYQEQFKFWVEDSYFDDATKQELLAIRNDEKEIEERFYKDLEFGTGGLRGVIGAGITLTVIKSMEQLGPAKAALLIVIAQLIIAYVIELLGLFGVEKEPLEWRKIIGMVIALIGVAIFQWK